jgi:hypothetical protein
MHPVQEAAMEGAAVGVRFDSTHLFLDMSDGLAVSFPLDWFPVLQAATASEREHFAISMDRQQLFWPEIDEDVNVPALLSFQSENAARSCDSPEGDFPAWLSSTKGPRPKSASAVTHLTSIRWLPDLTARYRPC